MTGNVPSIRHVLRKGKGWATQRRDYCVESSHVSVRIDDRGVIRIGMVIVVRGC